MCAVDPGSGRTILDRGVHLQHLHQGGSSSGRAECADVPLPERPEQWLAFARIGKLAQVLADQKSSLRLHVAQDLFCDPAGVEALEPVVTQPPKRVRQGWLEEEGSRFVWVSVCVQERLPRVSVGEPCAVLVEQAGLHARHVDAAFGQFDGGGQEAFTTQAAVAFVGVVKSFHEPGNGDGAVTRLAWTSRDFLGRGPPRCACRALDRERSPALCVVNHHHGHAADAGGGRFHIRRGPTRWSARRRSRCHLPRAPGPPRVLPGSARHRRRPVFLWR